MLGLLALLGIALGLLLTLLTAMLAWEMVHPPRRTAAWALARGLPCDPGEMNLKFEEWWLERSNPGGGVRLPVWEVVSPSPPGSAGGSRHSERAALTAVFVHGWGHGRVNSLQRIRPFLPLVDRIVLYDLRGHGESTGSPSMLGDGEDDDLLALLEQLGPGPLLLVGHSMGSVIALRTAAKLQPPLAPGSAGGSSVNRPMIAGVIAYGPYCEFHCSLEGRLRVNGLPGRPISDLALLVHRLRGVRPASINPDALHDMRIPLLVIHGVEDQVSPLAHARRIVEAAPDAELIEVNDAAHTDAHSVDEPLHDEAVRAFMHRVRMRVD
jgi:pimeloyl-ACP methyl ester carboxylesterase